ncbi:MAG: transcription termination factor Rho [Acidobacteriota bacterium]
MDSKRAPGSSRPRTGTRASARRTEGQPGPAGDGRHVTGVADLGDGDAAFLRRLANNYLPSRGDPLIPLPLVREWGLRDGTEVSGVLGDEEGRTPTLASIQTAGSRALPAEHLIVPQFQDLVSINPHEMICLGADASATSLRVIDLVAPVGRGQRGLIVSPPRAGKTTLLEQIGCAIIKHHSNTHLIMLLIDERPEEVTHFRRAVGGEVLASSADSESDAHLRLAWIAVERAKRLAEAGRHVVILLDSLTRLGRASNREMGRGGRTMSGGVDSRALQFPRQFFGAARCCEGAGSLTILATVLIDTASRMDEVIFQEFKGTGNMELLLDRDLAERRIFPAVDVLRSGTRREELLCSADELRQRHRLRRALADLPLAEAARKLIALIEKTASNADLLQMMSG